MDTIYIHGLQFETIIGIYDWEQAAKQPIILDIDIGTSFQKAIQSDDIKDCINYAEVADKVTKIAKSHHYKLVETFAEHIAQIILKDYQANWVRIKLDKPKAIGSAVSTGIIIERKKESK